MFTTRLSGSPSSPLRRTFLINAAVLSVATLALAASPATVSFPIAVAEAIVLAGGLATALAFNLVLLPRTLRSANGRTPPRSSASEAALALDAAAPPVANRGSAPRLMVCWAAPRCLSDAEADAWASRELTPALQAARIEAAQLTRLRRATPRHPTCCDWLLEFDVEPGRNDLTCLASPLWADWLDDLRLLGLHPAAVLAERGRVIVGEAD